MKQIKVLFITHVNQMGGANRSMFQLIKELKDYYLVIPYVSTVPVLSYGRFLLFLNVIEDDVVFL